MRIIGKWSLLPRLPIIHITRGQACHSNIECLSINRNVPLQILDKEDYAKTYKSLAKKYRPPENSP